MELLLAFEGLCVLLVAIRNPDEIGQILLVWGAIDVFILWVVSSGTA